MKPKYKLTILATLLLGLEANAQFTINLLDPSTAAAMVMGPNVNVSNATFTGDPIQMGWADNIPSFTTNGGLILSTSHIQSFYPGSSLGEPTSPVNTEDDLLTIANSVPPLIGQAFTVADVNDVAILEFDFVAPSAYINLNFVYGSDEYLTYVNTQYNDVFAILISGPGITGPFASPPAFPDGSANLGIVPNSNPPLPITISSLNNQLNSEYYIDNPGNTFNSGVSLKGYTTIISSGQVLVPGATYHLKLAIADGSDNSLKSQVIMNTVSFPNGPPVEMCASILEESICLEESVQLTTIPIVLEGVSYDNGIYIPDNQGCLETEVTFTEFGDAVIDDVSDINRIYFNMEHSFIGDLTITLRCPNGTSMIILPEELGSGLSLGIPGQLDDFIPGIGFTYSFSPAANQSWLDYLNDGGASPIPAGDYAPAGSFADMIGCPLNGTWTLEVCDLVSADKGFVFEFGVLFSGTALGNTHTWSTGETSPTITVSPDETTTYYLYSETNEGLCIDSVTVYVVPPVQISTDGPAAICNENPVTLNASGTDSYIWNDGSTGSQIQVLSAGTYFVTGSTAICSSSDTIYISALGDQLPIFTEATEFCTGDTITLWTNVNFAECSACSDSISYCYSNFENQLWTYCTDNPENGIPISIYFISGEVEDSFDDLTIYDGSDLNSPIIATWDNGDATGQGWTALSGCITMQLTTDGSVSCGDSLTLPWVYSVQAPLWINSSFYWNNGATGSTIEITSGGDYFVAGTDENGCNFSSDIISITEYAFDNSITATDNAICDGESVMLEVMPLEVIQWNNGATTPDLIVNEPGTYYAFLSNGPCEGYTPSIEITEGVTPNVAAFAVLDTLCNAGSTTLLFGTPAGGTWDGAGITNNEFSSALSGTGEFDLTYNYTNPEGCSASANETVTVIVCTDVTETETLDRYTIFPNPFNNFFQIQHPGGSYFSIELFDASGKLIYSSVARENIRIATDFIQAGMYTIRITDEHSSKTYPLVKMN
jgi:subtilisin-like proprotein convertase family protein